MEGNSDLTGVILDERYRVIERVAAGAMGVVYRAERVQLGKIVAVKVLHDELPDELSSRKRFEIEAMAMARLEHPHCAAVLDVGTHDGKPYVVMDFIAGPDLKTVLGAGPLAIGRAVEIVRQVLSGLAHAHELGIIHRDIKPANIILSFKAGIGDHVKILDFGLARLQQEQTTKLTTGIVIGTPAYMAPEQVRGRDIDARADLYACGILLMELLTGHRPFHSVTDDPIEVVTMQLKGTPPTLAQLRPGTGFGELEAVVAKALAKSADDRYQTAGEFASALDGAHRRSSASLAMPAPEGGGAALVEGTSAVTPSMVLPAPAPAPVPVDGTSAISPSMMLPAAGTRLGLAVRVAGPAPGSAPPGPPAPLADAAPASAPASAPGEALVTAPPGPPAVLAPPAFLIPSRPASAPGEAVASEAASAPGEAANAGDPMPTPPVASASPAARPSAIRLPPLPARTIGPLGLPYTTRQLAIAGGGLAGVILLIGLAARGCGGAPAVAPGAGSATADIEMEPVVREDDAQLIALAKSLIARGERDGAIKVLKAARVRYPDSGELAYLLGSVYMTKLWWSQGLAQLRDAIAREPAYAQDPELIKQVLKGFNTTPSYNDELAEFLRQDIGAEAVPYLDETATGHPNPAIRARATAELERYR